MVKLTNTTSLVKKIRPLSLLSAKLMIVHVTPSFAMNSNFQEKTGVCFWFLPSSEFNARKTFNKKVAGGYIYIYLSGALAFTKDLLAFINDLFFSYSQLKSPL